ncbi:hypothetical protein ORV05_01800 [Amycolatopsis cynarae]|uniref:Uncharacterized protein n=1 Tax=Amycolatopsis cynarae TaxID=2995223 RepID=A0ABY7B5Q6_9PSEU|nr:hypothetical protein [Amycolatopsis sp. HUAS 11-8]WAL66577.1 hypothetical protein ORV05_01800 [Amycolatopsis sp. HUAS 11-8]
MATLRELADRMVALGMVAEEQAAAVLADIGRWREEHLDEQLDERDLFGWLPEFGIAVSVHGEDVDFVEDYYRSLLEETVTACTGGAMVITGVRLLRDEDFGEFLYFLRDGEPVWWHVEHESDDYVDQMAVFEQFGDLDPGGDDPRGFYQLLRKKHESCQDDVYVLATPEQARALRDEFGLDFCGLDADRSDSIVRADRFLGSWLSEMDDALAAWRARFLPGDFPFDFSFESLTALGRLLLARFDGWSAVKRAAEEPFVSGAVRYLGETLIRAVPCRWSCWYVEDEPVLEIVSDTPAAFRASVVPLAALARAAGDRDPGALDTPVEELRDAVDQYVRMQRLLSAEVP